MLFTLAALMFVSTIASAVGESVDIKIESGARVSHSKTDSKGKFATKILEAGTYKVDCAAIVRQVNSNSTKAPLKIFITINLAPGNRMTVNGRPIDSGKPIALMPDTTIEIALLKAGTISGWSNVGGPPETTGDGLKF